MKKFLSLIVVISLVMSTLGTITASAIVAPEDAIASFDINQYTINDLINMNTEERKVLLDNYIETYNPYGIKDLIEEATFVESVSDAELQWDSGRNFLGTEQEIATHQIVTLEAFARFIENHGFYSDVDGTEILVISLSLAAASGLPDIDSSTFKGHFYDPDTGKNFVGNTSPTAKSRTGLHYHNAWATLSQDFFMDVMSDDFKFVIEEIGRALHYIQDLCEPHHASNKIALLSNHAEFEAYVERNIDTLIENIPNVSCQYDAYAYTNSAFDLAHFAATKAKPKYEYIKLGANFYNIGYSSICEAVYFSEALIYKLIYCSSPYTS